MEGNGEPWENLPKEVSYTVTAALPDRWLKIVDQIRLDLAATTGALRDLEAKHKDLENRHRALLERLGKKFKKLGKKFDELENGKQ